MQLANKVPLRNQKPEKTGHQESQLHTTVLLAFVSRILSYFTPIHIWTLMRGAGIQDRAERLVSNRKSAKKHLIGALKLYLYN